MVVLSLFVWECIDLMMSISFVCDLCKWLQIMEVYEGGGFVYYVMMFMDSFMMLCDVMKEIEVYGFDKVKVEQLEFGECVCVVLMEKGFRSVVVKGFEVLGVVVSYMDDDGICIGQKFVDVGLQIVVGVLL